MCPVELPGDRMDWEDKKVKAPASIDKIAVQGMVLTEALYEILADNGVLTQTEVVARARKLTTEIKVNLTRSN